MKALILYVLFVLIGALISTGIGYYVEKEVSSAASLVVFLALFFANFAVSWIAVILVMDGNLKNAHGEKEQRENEGPRPAPLDAGQRPEDDGVDEIARGVELQLGAHARPVRRQTGTPLVVVGGVERAERALHSQKTERGG